MLRGFFNALRFLTIIPLPEPRFMTEKDIGRAALWYPLTGLVIGGILVLAYIGLNYLWSPFVSSSLLVFFWIILTRAFHLDGLADTLDGIGGAREAKRRREIMKDSRIGAFGVIGIVCIIALKIAFVTELGNLSSSNTTAAAWKALLIAPVLGRWVILLAVVLFPPALDKGLGAMVKKYCKWPELIAGGIMTVIVLLSVGGWQSLVLTSILSAAATLTAWALKKALEGLNGDSYGALCEVTELIALALISALPFFAGPSILSILLPLSA